MQGLISENLKMVKGISPSADMYDGDPVSDAVQLGKYEKAMFVIHQKTAGTNTGTATITLLASSDASATGAEAIAFKYRKMTNGTSDTESDITAATTSGFTTTANEDTAYRIEINSAELPAGKPWVTLKATEVVNDPVIGDCMIYLSGRNKAEQLPTAIA